MEDNLNNNKEETTNIDNHTEVDDNLSSCLKEKDEYLDGWKRAKAELINYKKDEAKRFEMMLKFGQETLIKEIIKVLDSFDLAILAMEGQARTDADLTQTNAEKNNLRGIYLIRTQLEDVLKQTGLEKVVIDIGQPYNPSLAEVIAAVESDKPEGTIIEEVEKGYFLHGKLIRPARVKVAK